MTGQGEDRLLQFAILLIPNTKTNVQCLFKSSIQHVLLLEISLKYVTYNPLEMSCEIPLLIHMGFFHNVRLIECKTCINFTPSAMTLR